MMSKYFTPGTIVNLFPHDTQYKEAKILEITELNIVLEITSVNTCRALAIGDILFYPLNKVIMKKL